MKGRFTFRRKRGGWCHYSKATTVRPPNQINKQYLLEHLTKIKQLKI